MKICVKCGRERSEKYMQQAVFRGVSMVFDGPIDIWRCASIQSCKQYRRKNRETVG